MNPNDCTKAAPEDIYSIVRKQLKVNKCRPLGKKQLMFIVNLMDHREARARLHGYDDGKKSVTTKEQMRVDLSISLQKLVESNARLADALAKALDLNR